MLLHHAQELDNDLGAGPNQDLASARLLGIVDGIESVVEHTGLDHLCVVAVEIKGVCGDRK